MRGTISTFLSASSVGGTLREEGGKLTFLASDDTAQLVTERWIFPMDPGAKVYSDYVTIQGSSGDDAVSSRELEEDTTGVVD